MPVLYKRVKTKHNIDFITRTKCFYYNPANTKRKRGIRRYKTGEKKAETNKRNSYLKRKYELFNNFDVGDWWITLTEREVMPAQEAHQNMTRAISLLRKACKRKSIQLIYYAKTEAGECSDVRVRPHHHLIIKNTDPAIVGMLMQYWQSYGNVSAIKPIYNITDGRLITYFLDSGDHKDLDFEKYSHSRNLVQPEVETRIYPHESFRTTPRPPKCEYGYKYVIRNLYNGFPDQDGFTYQEYELIKVVDVQQE